MDDRDGAPDPCPVCKRLSTRPHDDCRHDLDRTLAQLPSLYHQLEQALPPGRRGTTSRAPSYGTRLPVRLDSLDLRARGGIEGVLTCWETDVRHHLALPDTPYRGTVEQQINSAVTFLRGNLLWILDQHPAAGDFATDIHNITAHATTVITGEPRERRLRLACPCGATLAITLSTPGRLCACGQQYGFHELRHLDLAPRNAA
ncbi:DUF7341 domain-containing protein [Streptomyces aureoversilis]|uniref:DUF7341 domain-containing protein n=1 Tax=Streptomyces aureoversilis TaxID=67277 RepID=A0ABV9ZV24_9ACTN